MKLKGIINKLLLIFSLVVTMIGINTTKVDAADYITYNGKVTATYSTVGDFTVGGQQAFCIEHENTTPTTGTAISQTGPYNNEMFEKALYYGWAGPKQWSGFTSRSAGIVATSLVLSHIYNGTSIKTDAKAFWNYLQSVPDIPDSKLSLSKSNLTTYISNGVQRTQSTKLSAIGETGAAGSLTLSLPTGIKLVNESTGKTYTGSATISNGQTFYLTASIGYDGNFDSGNVSGNNIYKFQPIIFKTASTSLQDLSAGRLIIDPNPTVRLTADFEATLGDISLTKTLNRSDSAKATVAGATYGLYARTDILNGVGAVAYKTGALIGYKTTDDQGKLNFSNLFVGNYYIKEIGAPAYTMLDSTQYNVSLSATGSMSANVTTQNDIQTRDISFAKKDDGGHMISGATMELRDNSGKLIDQWISTNSLHVVKNLPVGNAYTLKETATPYGYLRAGDISFVVGDSSQTITMVDKQPTGIINLSKSLDRNDSAGASVAGAQYSLYSSAGKLIATKTTDKNGNLIFDNLPLGDYYIQETKAPNFTQIDSNKYNVSLGYKDQYTSVITYDLDTVNHVLVRDVSFSKVDSQGKLISGAAMQLLDESGKQIDQWTSSSAPYVINDLPVGNSYTLIETKAPDGYVLSNASVSFTVSDGVNEQKVVMTDNQIGISKENEEGALIPGATLQIIDSDGKVVDEWNSTDQIHYVSGLIVGNDYSLHEVAAPEGYLVAEDIEISVGSSDQIITMIDKEPTGVINLTKSLNRDDSENASAVGAEYSLYLKNGDLVEVETTDEDGKLSFDHLPLGDYYIQETKAPDFTNLDEKKYEVALLYENQNTAVITYNLQVTNEVLVRDISFSKVDSNKKLIAGATMQLLDGNGDLVDEWISSSNPYVIEDLPLGNIYTLKEIKAPEGYVLADAAITFTIGDGSDAQNIAMTDNQIGISKENEEGSLIPGATLQVIDTNGKVVDEWVSTDQIHYVSGLIVGNDYTLHEVLAPVGYLQAEDIDFRVDSEDQIITMTDKSPTGIINLTKSLNRKDSAKAIVAGAEYSLFSFDGTLTAVGITDEEGRYSFENLPLGDYYIRETKAPDYTMIDRNKYEISLIYKDQDTAIITYDLETVNDIKVKDLVISKVDVAGIKIPGSSMELVDENDVVIVKWVSTDEPYAVKNLPVGNTYTLHELKAPDGCVLANDVTFTLEDDGTVEQHIDMIDEIVSVSKTDLIGEAELVGATLQIIDSDGKMIDEWISDGNPHDVSGLVEGRKYSLIEIVAPEGYVLSTDSIDFRVSELKENKFIVMKDNYVAVSKEEPDGTKVIGATLQVLDEEGNIIDEWVSDNQEHYVSGLTVFGTYTLHEAKVPEGYLAADDIVFNVDKDNQEVIMIDDFTKITVTKYDITNQKELAGASMQVIDGDGKVIDEWISTYEPHLIKYLEIGKTYTLKEIIAPIGYTIAQEAQFTVTATGVEQQIEMYDELLPMAVMRTGDDSPIVLYAGLSVLSLIVLITVSKKRNTKDK